MLERGWLANQWKASSLRLQSHHFSGLCRSLEGMRKKPSSSRSEPKTPGGLPRLVFLSVVRYTPQEGLPSIYIKVVTPERLSTSKHSRQPCFISFVTSLPERFLTSASPFQTCSPFPPMRCTGSRVTPRPAWHSGQTGKKVKSFFSLPKAVRRADVFIWQGL